MTLNELRYTGANKMDEIIELISKLPDYYPDAKVLGAVELIKDFRGNDILRPPIIHNKGLEYNAIREAGYAISVLKSNLVGSTNWVNVVRLRVDDAIKNCGLPTMPLNVCKNLI